MSIGGASSAAAAGAAFGACSSPGARRRRRRKVRVRLPDISRSFLRAMRPGIVTGEPEAHVGGLDGLAHGGVQVRADAVDVELVAQPRAERLEHLGRVVAAAIETPVDRALDARAGRAE